MKLLLSIACVVVATVLVHGDFITFVKDIQTHRDFQNLSVDDKILFSELVMAAETDSTKEFIDRVGLLPVLELIHRLSFVDASKFSAYLAEDLGYHHHRPSNSDVLTRRSLDKRDDDDDDDDDSGSSSSGGDSGENNLNEAEKRVLGQVSNADTPQELTDVITDSGYGVIFGLLENMDENQADGFLNMMEGKLRAETEQVAMEKRDDDDDDSGSSSSGSAENGKSNLNHGEKQVWGNIKDAAETNAAAKLLDNAEYGVIFGLLENMDETQANEFLQVLESQLREERPSEVALEKRDDDDDDDDDSSGSSSSSAEQTGSSNLNQGASNLNQGEKQVWASIKDAAETNAVTELLSNTGYGAVFGLLENMDETQANEFLQVLESQLRQETPSEVALEKRDDDDDDGDSGSSSSSAENTGKSHLNSGEKKVLKNIEQAAETNTVTDVLSNTDYGVIFGLLENMNEAEADEFLLVLQSQLNTEAAQEETNVEKRDDDDDDDDDDKHEHSDRPFATHLSDREKRVWDQIKHHSDKNTLAIYIQQHGYGVIFGLLETTRERSKHVSL